MLMLLATFEQNAFSVWVRESPSLLAFPFILYLHTLGLAMLAGINVGLDLWLLARRTVPPFDRFLPARTGLRYIVKSTDKRNLSLTR